MEWRGETISSCEHFVLRFECYSRNLEYVFLTGNRWILGLHLGRRNVTGDVTNFEEFLPRKIRDESRSPADVHSKRFFLIGLCCRKLSSSDRAVKEESKDFMSLPGFCNFIKFDDDELLLSLQYSTFVILRDRREETRDEFLMQPCVEEECRVKEIRPRQGKLGKNLDQVQSVDR